MEVKLHPFGSPVPSLTRQRRELHCALSSAGMQCATLASSEDSDTGASSEDSDTGRLTPVTPPTAAGLRSASFWGIPRFFMTRQLTAVRGGGQYCSGWWRLDRAGIVADQAGRDWDGSGRRRLPGWPSRVAYPMQVVCREFRVMNILIACSSGASSAEEC
jgi:hypothetical protein